MKSVFISYSHSDSEKARLLSKALMDEGLSVFSVDELVLGSDWQGEILSAIKRCSIFIALVGESESNVMLELGYALGSAKQVLLIVGSNVRIPIDIASLPVLRFDQFDNALLYSVVEVLKNKLTGKDETEKHFLKGQEVLQKMLEDQDFREQVSPRDFEEYVFTFFRELGFEASQMPFNHDGGYDIYVADPGTSFKSIIEVKKFTKNSMAGVSYVRQLLGSMMMSEVSCAILVSTSGFSASAKSLAQKAPLPIILLTLEDLVNSTKKSITRLIQPTQKNRAAD